jgi:hypothetical protein
MTGMINNLTGKTAKEAERAQALQRQQQDVANARQLSMTAAETARTGLSRRNPRGRKLLADASPSAMPTTVA